jgi:hypothetical protein
VLGTLTRVTLLILRAGVVTAGLVLGSWATTAVAAPPEGWENADNDSMLVSLLKLVVVPLAIIAVITLLTYLPSIMRAGRGPEESAAWFAEHSEWFGGPRTTPEAVESRAMATEAQVGTRGGASARW